MDVSLVPYSRFPKGFDCEKGNIPEYDQLLNASKAAVLAVESVNGLKFKAESICKTLFSSGGGAVDYFYKQGVKYTLWNCAIQEGVGFWCLQIRLLLREEKPSKGCEHSGKHSHSDE
jgi:hypothetical protein